MPETADELCYLPISALGPQLRARRLSPVELVEAYLARITRLDGQLHTFLTLTPDRARMEARAAEAEIARGEYRGPLHGVPLAIKDLYQTTGIRTTAHSQLLADWVPDQDATCVRLLAEAGAVLLGKLSLHEFGFGGPNLEGYFPPARNPWDFERIPAGSSSGSGAGLAAGLFAGSLGTDSGGSIRGPAAICGVVGLKPTYGLCSRAGVVPVSSSLDHTGPMARTVEDCVLLLQAIAGHDPSDPASVNVQIPDYRAALEGGFQRLRVGAPISYLENLRDLDPDVFAAYRAALETIEQFGASVETVELPEQEQFESVGSVIMLAEAYAYHQENLRTRPQLYGGSLFKRLSQAALLSVSDYQTALRGQVRIKRAISELMAHVDLLALPTTAQPAPTFAEEAATPSGARTNLRRVFNITGQPAISVPCGFSWRGLPIGLQLAGRPFEDATVLRAAHVYEQATDWHTRRPPLG